MKTLKFEGAGWDKADHNGVGNCRIRTTFYNKQGRAIYLEIIGIKPHKWSPSYIKKYNHAACVSHCFYLADKATNSSVGLSRLERLNFEYTKENILRLVNSLEIGGDFDAIEVCNSDWNGFAIDGKDESLNKNTQSESLGVNRKA